MKVELAGHYGPKRLIQAVVPTIIMMVVMSVYSIVDGLFVSRYVGAVAFAAVNFIMPVLMFMGATGTMIGTGGSALVSKTMGEGCRREAQAIFSMLIKVLIALGLLSMMVLLMFLPVICRFLGADEAMMDDCVTYGRLCALGAVPVMLQMAFQSFYMTAEKPQLGTIMSIVSGLTNIGLDALFIACFGWGIKGAAIATGVAAAVGGFFPLIYFVSKRNTSALRFINVGVRWKHVRQTCFNGLSEFVSAITMSVVSMCYNAQLMRFIGSDGVAAYGVIMYISYVYAAIFMGYNLAVEPIIGFNYGARNHVEMRSLVKKSFLIIGVTGLLMTLFAEVTSGFASRMFVGYDAALLTLTTRAVRIYMLCFLICGISMFISALFTALNNGLISAIAALFRSLICELVCVFLLPALFGADGIWYSVDVAEVLALVLCIFLFCRFRGRYGY